MGLLGSKNDRVQEYIIPKDGRVHLTIVQVTFTSIGAARGSGEAAENAIQNIQNQDGEIMSVSCYVTDDKYVQAIIVYKSPKM